MNQEKIGKFISKCRKEKEMTQEELAEKLNVNNRTISRWENVKNMPDVSLFNSLCEELGITINELLCGEKIVSNNYQEKFEENIVNVMTDIKKRRKKLKLILSILIILLLINGLYNSLEYDVEYREGLMNCYFKNNTLFLNITSSMYNTSYEEKIIDGEKYIFFHSTRLLKNKKRIEWEHKENLASYIENGTLIYSYGMSLEQDLNDNYDNIYVYYTNSSLEDIELKESYLLCSYK